MKLPIMLMIVGYNCNDYDERSSVALILNLHAHLMTANMRFSINPSLYEPEEEG